MLRGEGGRYELVTLEVGDPGPGEVLVEMAYAGLCHSDEHLRHSNAGGRYPIVGGHEGSGVVLAVGPGVRRVAPGDHVVASFLPACGTLPVVRVGPVQPVRPGRHHRHRPAAHRHLAVPAGRRAAGRVLHGRRVRPALAAQRGLAASGSTRGCRWTPRR